MDATIPEFGQRKPGQTYRPRPAAYAVVSDAQRQVAVVRTPKGHFLPGGGIETGETAEEALVREVREECGRNIRILGKIGEANEHVFVEGKGYFAIHGVFFRASFGDSSAQPAEADHELVWLSADEAKNRLTREGHVWAVAQALVPAAESKI
jgi:8-oxo-dGTP diphosphatase